MSEYIRGERPWSQLYRFLARLPRWSHFHASVMDDEESVAGLLDQEADREPGAFGLRDWTHERELLTAIVDQLGALHATLIQVNSDGGKRPEWEPMRRPKTALDRMEARRAKEAHEQRVRMLRPVPD